MDGPWSRGYGARSGYDVRARRLRGGPEGRDGVNRDVHTMKIEIEHEGSCLGATGGTGQLIVRDALAKGHSVVVLVRSKARALDLPGSGHDRRRCSIASPTTATSSRPATRAG